MEHNQHKKDTLRDSIMGRIKTEHIEMRPRLYFTLQVVAIAAVAFLILLFTIFIFNFILFTLRINSHDAFLSFGPRGIVAFLTFFPWLLLIVDVLLIAILEWLLRTFKFGYRLPILYVLGAILLLTLMSGFTLDRGTGFNERLMRQAEGEHHLPPPLNALYSGARRAPHDGVCRCTVLAIGTSTITVVDRHHDGRIFIVRLPANDFHATSSGLSVGDTVMVAGDDEGNEIRAYGVRFEESRGFEYWEEDRAEDGERLPI